MNDNRNPFKAFQDEEKAEGSNNQRFFDDEIENENQMHNQNSPKYIKQPNEKKGKIIILNENSVKEQICYDNSDNKPKAASNEGAPNVAEQISNNTMTQINSSLGFIEKYFNVEIKDVLDRLKGAVIPFNKSFYQTAEKNPDLYGPLWIYTTIIFAITVASNISGYLGIEDSTTFRYNYNIIPYAALFIYGLGFGAPVVIFLVTRFAFKVAIELILNISLYGYSFVVLIPISFLCIIPNNIAQAVLLGYFILHSGAFIFFNMWLFISEKAPTAKYVILGILGGIHVLLFFGLDMFFFSESRNKSASSSK